MVTVGSFLYMGAKDQNSCPVSALHELSPQTLTLSFSHAPLLWVLGWLVVLLLLSILCLLLVRLLREAQDPSSATSGQHLSKDSSPHSQAATHTINFTAPCDSRSHLKIPMSVLGQEQLYPVNALLTLLVLS